MGDPENAFLPCRAFSNHSDETERKLGKVFAAFFLGVAPSSFFCGLRRLGRSPHSSVPQPVPSFQDKNKAKTKLR